MMASRLERFFFFQESDRWISVLRLGLALQVIGFCLALRKDWTYLLSAEGRGLVSRDLMEAALNGESSFIPRLGWLMEFAKKLALPESAALWLVWSCLLIAALFLFLGLFSRATAIITWLIHLCVIKSIGYLSYGMDNLTTIGLFYLMIAPLPDSLSLDSMVRSRSANPELISFFRRVLQVHVCLIYFFGGLAKLAGVGWWNGTSLWRALTVPPFHFVDPELVLRYQPFLPAAGLVICLLEFCYPFFIWKRRTRSFWLILVCLMHLMIALTMGMFLFSFIMIVLNLAAFMPWPCNIVRPPAQVISPESPTTELSGLP
jgi:hypothetical protein